MHPSVKARIDALTTNQMSAILLRRPCDEPATDDEMRSAIRELYRLGAIGLDALIAAEKRA